MRRRVVPITALFLACLPTVPARAAAASSWQGDLLIERVTIVDLETGSLRKNMSVLVSAGRIAAVAAGPLRAPPGTRRIQAHGKFVMPGLWDMHVHLGGASFDRDVTLPLFLANGVTGIRVMLGDPAHYRWRAEVAAGRLLGPRMVVASEPIDEAQTDPGAARSAVRRAKAEGADFFKVRDNLPRQSYFAAIAEARIQGLPVEGHTPRSVTVAEAASLGQRTIEHFTGLDAAERDSAVARAVAANFRKFGTWHCPTLVMRRNYSILDHPGLARDARLRFVKPEVRASWANETARALKAPEAEYRERRETVLREMHLVDEFRRAGVPILAGTDNGNPYVIAGFSLHEELELLVASGFSPLEALRAATLNPARFFDDRSNEKLIQPGARADLLLLDASPLANVANTRRIAGVIAGGRWLHRGTVLSKGALPAIRVGLVDTPVLPRWPARPNAARRRAPPSAATRR